MGLKTFLEGVRVVTTQYPLWSGRSHPDVSTTEARQEFEGDGSKPLATGDLLDKGTTSGALGGVIRRLTEYMGGKLIERYGDYFLSTQFGSLLTDGRKKRIKEIVAAASTAECYLVKPHDHFLKINQYALTGTTFYVFLPSLEDVASSATLPDEIQSYTARGLIADADVDRQFWGRELHIEAKLLGQGGEIELRQGRDLTQHGLTWFQSAGDTDEWYVATTAGGDPSISDPAAYQLLFIDRDKRTYNGAGPGNLLANQFGYGDNDSLGFNTIYVYIGAAGTNPNLRNIVAGYGLVDRLENIGDITWLIPFWNESTDDAAWNVWFHGRSYLDVSTTTGPPSTVVPSTLYETDAPTTT